MLKQDDTNRLFVYGTLKSGFNRSILEEYSFIGNAKVNGTLYDLGSFPVIDLDTGDTVYGELYEINGYEDLFMIDVIEGFYGEGSLDNFYDRKVVKVFLDNLETMAYIYFMPIENIVKYGGKKIKSGIWEKK